MKKNVKILTLSLMGASLVLAGCNKSESIVEPNVIPESEGKEVSYNADSWKEIISEDCTHFFDGCNNCSKVEGEEGVAACTMMYCEVYEEPRCTDDEIEISAYNADSWKEIISEDCTYFFDGCNDCSRIEGEDGVACTKMYCEVYEEPRCTDYEIIEEPEIFGAEVLDGGSEDEVILEPDEAIVSDPLFNDQIVLIEE